MFLITLDYMILLFAVMFSLSLIRGVDLHCSVGVDDYKHSLSPEELSTLCQFIKKRPGNNKT